MGIPEVELGEIAGEVGFGDVMERSGHAALQDGEEAFHGVRVNVTADILVLSVVDLPMAGELGSDLAVLARLIGHERGLAAHLGAQDRGKRLAGDIGDVERAGASAAFDQGKDDLLADASDLARLALGHVLVGFLPADVGFVGFDDLAVATHRGAVVGHGFADPMAHEPGGLVGDAERAVQLVG